MNVGLLFALTSFLWPHLAEPALAPVPSVQAAPQADAPVAADAILGEWWTEGKEGRMKFVKTKSGSYEALVTWGNKPKMRDTKNPDPKLRDRLVLGSVLIWHLRYEDGEYVDGYVYNPRDGNTYRMKAKLTSPSRLTIRGYLAVPLLGQSQEWTRVE
jgi:uncharacterized protein (DUF2147 family)